MEIKTTLTIAITIISFVLLAWMFPGKIAEDAFKKLKLFPRWFKILGAIIFIASATVPFKYEALLFEGTTNYLGVHSAIIGLFLFSFSRDKVEDEMTSMIRLKSLYRSTIMAFVITMLSYTINSIGDTEGKLVPGIEIIMILLTFYLISFYYSKFRLRKE